MGGPSKRSSMAHARTAEVSPSSRFRARALSEEVSSLSAHAEPPSLTTPAAQVVPSGLEEKAATRTAEPSHRSPPNVRAKHKRTKDALRMEADYVLRDARFRRSLAVLNRKRKRAETAAATPACMPALRGSRAAAAPRVDAFECFVYAFQVGPGGSPQGGRTWRARVCRRLAPHLEDAAPSPIAKARSGKPAGRR